MTTLDRRTFLRWTAASGLAVSAAPVLSRGARAGEPFAGPFWITIHADGGWDPTLLCDPKGARSEDDPDPVNSYHRDDIEQVGPFKVPPVEGHRAFFERFRNELLVLNGIDAQTNSHETGTRYAWCGSMDPGVPSLAALVAARPADRPSLSYVSHGGYDVTAGLVAPTRLADTSAILEIAHPERLDPDEADSTILPGALMDRLRTARGDRLQRQIDAASLPRVKRSMSVLQEARSGDNELARLAEVLPDDLVDTDNRLISQAETALACFKAGVSVSASLSYGGFDTHGDHDDSHTPRMQRVVEAITWIWDEAERLGIADQLVVVVGSDFARTPWYNDNMGKDHWSITSMLLMGAGIQGGRVIGETDGRQVPLDLDPETLRPTDKGGVRITYADVHASLRQLAGLQGWDVAERFDVGTALPILG